ncbi:hypothetical protein BDW02DRAFT_635299 [Decorospora gaudefroyi]|uniref:Uncharacterized protein n=1 Tax=Decorospora gaudefroyi TaxID=184978 RepID=A0A6A5K1F0_9PLEO|nr:hypothetical protein BDW02DRAFT_635299 [Decorospora gaudefroyi]
MYRHINQHLVLALLCLLPAIHGFWWSTENAARSVSKRDYTPESHRSLWGRADDPETEGEEDIPTNLGLCVPRCILTKEPKSGEGTPSKRSDILLSDDNACSRASSACSRIRDSSTSNSTHRLSKRATGRPLPGFNSDDDLRKKDKQEMSDWIMNRMPDPRRAGYPNDVAMLWDYANDQQYIELIAYKRTGYSRAYGIPTSFFEVPGDEPFAWGTIGLVRCNEAIQDGGLLRHGCTAFTVVKTPTESDPNSGVYMAHIWETPGFSNHRTPAIPAIPATDGEPAQKAEPERTWTLAQPKAYIKDFIRKGFPQIDYDRWLPLDRRSDEHKTTELQQGLNTYATQLQYGQVHVMHPQKYDPVEEGEEEEPDRYEIGEGPQHPDGLELLHKTINQVMRKKITFVPDYLYVPAREDEDHTRAWDSPSGRSLFEYDPRFDLGDGRTARMGMLLYEDGGPRGAPDEEGNYEPGPGGPFFFNFGLNDEDVMDID